MLGVCLGERFKLQPRVLKNSVVILVLTLKHCGHACNYMYVSADVDYVS